MPINESYHISSFRSRKFIDRFLDSWLDLKLPNRGRKLKQSLEIPILTRERYVFTRKDPCLGKERSVFQVASRLRNIFCLNPHRKNYISGCI